MKTQTANYTPELAPQPIKIDHEPAPAAHSWVRYDLRHYDTGEVWHLESYEACFGTAKVDIEAKTVTIDDRSDLPTVDELIECRFFIAVNRLPYRECRMMYPGEPKAIDTAMIVDFFKKRGFVVTEEAILHNFEAWRDNLKSGFRDEEHGTYLFTPTGENPLSFTVESLDDPDRSKWLKTYTA